MSPDDVWAAGQLYEPYVGRWSRLVAPEFVRWLSVPEDKDWVDVGCGTGALTQAIIDVAAPRSVAGIDPSSGFVAYAEQQVTSPLASFRLGEVGDLETGTADVVVSGLVLNFIPDAAGAVEHMTRIARPGGVVAAYVWDYAGKMELMRYFWDAAVALDPAAVDLDEGRRFSICAPEPLERLFTEAGLQGVDVRPIDVPTRFRDFDDYWQPFLGGQAPAPGYNMSLSEERRNTLRDRIRTELPIAEDGSIDLIARAWAVRGRTV